MDHSEKIQNEVNNIIANIRGRGWKLTRTTKKALAEAEALGLAQYLGAYARPEVKGAEIVNAVIDAAKDAGGKTITESGWAGGDGYADTATTKPSALYLALNETEDADEPAPVVRLRAAWRNAYEVGVRQYRVFDNKEGQPAFYGWSHNLQAIRRRIGAAPDNYRVRTHYFEGPSVWVLGSEWLRDNPA